MVLPKRLDYVSYGDQVPPIPYWPRSAKGKRSIRKKIEDNQVCPFDLLATVAGKLLTEGEYSIFSQHCSNGISNVANIATVKKETLCIEEILKTEAFDEQSCNDYGLAPEPLTKGHITFDLKKYSWASRPAGPEPFLLAKSDISDAIARKSRILNNRVKIGRPGNNAAAEECGTRRKHCSTFANLQVGGITKLQELEGQFPRNGVEFDSLHIYRLHLPVGIDVNPPSLLSSDSSAEVPECKNCVPLISSLPGHEDGLEPIVDRDDDENSSGCTHPSNLTNKAVRPKCIGNLGVRKLSAPNYWQTSPNVLYHDVETKLGFCRKKICYTRQRKQRSSKSRKLFKHQSATSSNERLFIEEDISDLCEKISIDGEACDPHLPAHSTIIRANGASSSKLAQSSSYNSVKLSIKSFKVPELFIEIPETATVGYLKRTVMEAVTAIVQGGLHVGVLLQGKKVRDDRKTLREAGISGHKSDNLGFTLEPTHTHSTQPMTSAGDPCVTCPGDAVEKLARISPVAHLTNQDTSDAIPQPALTSCPESDRDSIQSQTDIFQLDKIRANSHVLDPLPTGTVKALTSPLHKSRYSEHVQRRIRRPFSVAEVEALIQAVEKLGTGRWRDIKFLAFDNAKHRTYVDLKDKWKTLVHTARISPQQRRGEPVPQELLDRVLSAQAYWSQQQAKLQDKASIN